MKTILILLLMLCGISANASNLSKAFEALEIYNYFQAKKMFEKSLKKHPIPASFGLSIIYVRKDNPFSNLDSAHSKITLAFETYGALDSRLKGKYKILDVDSSSIVQQRDLISHLFYIRAIDVHSVYAFQDFIDKNPWSHEVDSAIYKRDELAFEQAIQAGGSNDYSKFLTAFPQSVFAVEAEEMLHRSVYTEQTFSNSFVDYVKFVETNPNSPYRGEAEDKVYGIATSTGTMEAFRNFIIEFPSNRNVPRAWKYLYNAQMQEEYSAQNILKFKNQYPDYPFLTELNAEYNMADKILYPIRTDSQWGYCDKTGSVCINSNYQSAEWFSEGLAVVKINEKYGYINKLGKEIIKAEFDDALPFHEGFALVEINDFWGIIDRNGDFIIPAKYEDLGQLKEGFCYYQEDDLYGYFDAKGLVRLKPQYSEAFDFENGMAIVSKNDYYGIIDVYGTTYIPFKYEDLYRHSHGKFVGLLSDYWGLINAKGDTILGFEYDFIGKPKGNFSIVELDGEYNYINQEGGFLLKEWLETFTEYRQIATFENGYAKIKGAKGFNLIDTLGNKIFKTDVEDVGKFADLIAVRKNGKWGYINQKAQVVIPYSYSYAYSFNGGIGIVQNEPFFGAVNKSGVFLIEPYQEELYLLSDSFFLCKSLGKYGLMSIAGDTLLSYIYKNIEPIDENVVKVEEGQNIFYYNIKLNQFIRKEE